MYNMHLSCKSCYSPEGWGEELKKSDFHDAETLKWRTIDAVGANVETRDFRTCSQVYAILVILRSSFLPVKRKAELKSAFRNCAPSRKHPQGRKCKHTMLNAWSIKEEGRQQKYKVWDWERCMCRHSQDRDLSKSKINPREAQGSFKFK